MTSLFVPREIKSQENRVALLPAAARQLSSDGHRVMVERGAGQGSGFSDEDYRQAGAELVSTSEQGFSAAELVVKVKEPQPEEFAALRPGQTWFTFFHFAADRTMTEAVLASGANALAYESLADEHARLPVLTPMSEVAGRLSVQEGAKMLLGPAGGPGILLGGVPGVEPAHVTVIGGGVVGTEAARMAAGLGARVVIVDTNLQRLRELSEVLPKNVSVLFSDPASLEAQLRLADLVIGAVLIRGARAPRLIRREHLALMKRGAVLVDVAVDQGGIAETIRPTTHAEPSYVVDGVIHYGVANIPGAVSRTSTRALCNATWPYLRALMDQGTTAAVRQSPALRSSVSVWRGHLTDQAVAESLEIPCHDLHSLLAGSDG